MKERNVALDITRIFAFFCVVAVHSLLNTGFYEVNIDGWKMYVMVGIRTALCVCVPLFLLLTGYLESQKEIELTKKRNIWILQEDMESALYICYLRFNHFFCSKNLFKVECNSSIYTSKYNRI